MRRREFISFLGGATAWPLGARTAGADPGGWFMSARSADDSVRLVAAFRQGLAEAGYVEGRNVALEFRWAEDQNDRLVALAADLVRRQVTVIVTDSTPGALAAERGGRAEAAAAAARIGPHGDRRCFARQPDQSESR